MMAFGKVGSVALCWRVERTDGAGIAVTTHDSVLSAVDVEYLPEPAVTPASVTRALALEAHSAEISGALSTDAISAGDLELGFWDGARITLLAIDWSDPESEPVILMAGELGEVASNENGFTAELRGAAARLNGPVCPATSAECRAELGDKSCRVNLAGRSIRAKVGSFSGTTLQLDRSIDESYVFGRLRYLSGPNCGASTIALSVNGSAVQVRDLPRGEIAPGTSVELRIGCDKRLETCRERFANAENFRGEPHLPGNDLLTRYPGT